MNSIWLVENDELQVGLIRRKLERDFPNWAIEVIRTEADFQDRLRGLVPTSTPAVIVQDLFMPWSQPGPYMEMPPEAVRRDGLRASERAGYRCAVAAAARELTRSTPIILYSQLDAVVVEPELANYNFPPHVTYLRKELRHQALADKIAQIL